MKKIYISPLLVVLLLLSNQVFVAAENNAGIVKIKGKFGDKEYDIELFNLNGSIKNCAHRDMSHENNQTLLAVKKDGDGQSYVSSLNYLKYKKYLDQDLKPREYDGRVSGTLAYVESHEGQPIYIKAHQVGSSPANIRVPALAGINDERANLYDAFCREVDNYVGEYGFMELVEKFNKFKKKNEQQEQISILGTVKIEDENGEVLKDVGVFQYTFCDTLACDNKKQHHHKKPKNKNNTYNNYKKYDEKCMQQKGAVKECDKMCYHRCFNTFYNSYGFNRTNNASTQDVVLAAIYDVLDNKFDYLNDGNVLYGENYTIEGVLYYMGRELGYFN